MMPIVKYHTDLGGDVLFPAGTLMTPACHKDMSDAKALKALRRSSRLAPTIYEPVDDVICHNPGGSGLPRPITLNNQKQFLFEPDWQDICCFVPQWSRPRCPVRFKHNWLLQISDEGKFSEKANVFYR